MKILFISLGCDKNLVDSEEMLGLLAGEHYEFTDDETRADIIIINTCCFINDAKEESIETILQMSEYRRDGNCKALIVTGCLAQRYQNEIRKEIPEVDAVLGTSSYNEIAAAVKKVIEGEKIEIYTPLDKLIVEEQNRMVTTGGHFAYLKIAEGCDKRCTYCIIPKIRGNYRSVPMEQLIASAEQLAEKGVKELILVAQETTVYGKDLYGGKKLPELLRRLCRIPGIVWIRLLYCYPEEITDELIETMKSEPKICHYMDMPIQHASDRILKAMGRRLPFTRGIYEATALSRFADGMAITLKSGLDSDEGLELSGKLTDSPDLREKIEECRKKTAEGEELGAAFQASGVFSGLHARMVNVGILSGSLDQVMERVAEQYAEEADERISKTVSRLEPTLVAVMSILVGMILLSVMLPLMGIMSGIG